MKIERMQIHLKLRFRRRRRRRRRPRILRYLEKLDANQWQNITKKYLFCLPKSR